MPTTEPLRISARDVLAIDIRPTLHGQRWSLAGSGAGALGRFVHLDSGRGSLRHTDGDMALLPSDLVWLPAGHAVGLQIAPGSEGIVVGVSDALLAAAIGSHAEAHLLRHLTARAARLTVHASEPRTEIPRSLRAIEAEARKGLEGSWSYLGAHLTIVLVWMWRLGGRDSLELPDVGVGTRRLLRFRQLVEAQFREHWPIARYAAALSTTPDRLHDLCTRSVGQPPLALVHQRVVREACRLLGHTDLGVGAVAGELGFASASHFSRFFRRWTDTSPQAWRERARQRAEAGQTALPAGYADWP